MTCFWKVENSAILSSQNGRFWAEIKGAKNMPKTIPQLHYSFPIEKSWSKHLILEKWRVFKTGKIDHFAKAIIRQNGQLGAKIKSVRETCQKPLYYHITAVLMNKSCNKHLILKKWHVFEKCKIGHSVKSTVRQNSHFGANRHPRNNSTITIELVYTKKGLKKTPNIGEMTRFWKVANSAILPRL